MTVFHVNDTVLEKIMTLSIGKGTVRLLALDLNEAAAL